MLKENNTKDMKMLVWKDIELIQQLAKKKGLNRQLDIKRLKSDVKRRVRSLGYRDFDKIYFPAKELMIHEHKAGKKCAPHMRVSIYFPELSTVIIDCDMHLWESFEKMRLPPEEKTPTPVLTVVPN